MKVQKDDGQLNLFPNLTSEPQATGRAVQTETKIYDHEKLFERLAESAFRSKFHLSKKDIEYIQSKGLDVIRNHAKDFVAKRLAPAIIPNDGKQTPMKGHPMFLAQHATACCCRGCFSKWHHIPAGRALTQEEQEYAVSVLMEWIERQMDKYCKTNHYDNKTK